MICPKCKNEDFLFDFDENGNYYAICVLCSFLAEGVELTELDIKTTANFVDPTEDD